MDSQTAKEGVGNTTGSLTLTLRVGDRLIVNVPGGQPIVVYCANSQLGRCSLNVRAPRAYKIDRRKGDQ